MNSTDTVNIVPRCQCAPWNKVEIWYCNKMKPIKVDDNCRYCLGFKDVVVYAHPGTKVQEKKVSSMTSSKPNYLVIDRRWF